MPKARKQKGIQETCKIMWPDWTVYHLELFASMIWKICSQSWTCLQLSGHPPCSDDSCHTQFAQWIHRQFYRSDLWTCPICSHPFRLRSSLPQSKNGSVRGTEEKNVSRTYLICSGRHSPSKVSREIGVEKLFLVDVVAETKVGQNDPDNDKILGPSVITWKHYCFEENLFTCLYFVMIIHSKR